VRDATTVTAVERVGGLPDTPCGPIIVLTYAHAGAELLTRALSASPSLACTSGTGLLPLCHSAVTTWQKVEDRGGAASALAMQSVRVLASTMAAVIQARAGASRWCETAFAGPAAAETFLRVFPAATFLCLHRSLRAVLAESIRIYPWGLGGSPFWPYSGSHPGNNVATVAAYWAACTEQLLEFETTHPESCLRVRHEDLVADPQRQASEVFTFLGLGTPARTTPGHSPVVTGPANADADAPGPPMPTTQIPPPLLARVSELHGRLDYARPKS
jgi:hypothetical protein